MHAVHGCRLALLVLALTWGTAAGWRDRKSAQAETKRLKSLLVRARDGRGDSQLDAYFSEWAQQHGRKYADNERSARLAQFRQGLQAIVEANEDPNATYWAAPNAFTDLSFEEFAERSLGTVLPPGTKPRRRAAPSRRELANPPPNFIDWTKRGKVTPVREQGDCGACWAFATVAALESLLLIQHNQEHDLSEQQLIDCVSAAGGYGSMGCRGGWSMEGLNYVRNGNLTTEDNYPFRRAAGQCDSDVLASTTKRDVARMKRGKGYKTLPSRSTLQLMKPVITAFNVNEALQYYAGGVFPADSCDGQTINHAALIVGYSFGSGIEAGDGYFLLKNSWGTDWGEDGYLRLQMTADGPGPCGLYLYNYAPTAVRPMV